jgi:hypothetical protein
MLCSFINSRLKNELSTGLTHILIAEYAPTLSHPLLINSAFQLPTNSYSNAFMKGLSSLFLSILLSNL